MWYAILYLKNWTNISTQLNYWLSFWFQTYCRYCDTINSMVHVMQQRQIQPQYQFEAIFAMTSMKKDYDQALATLHEFTKRVIRWSHLFFLIGILWNMIKIVPTRYIRQSLRLLRVEFQLKFLKNYTAVCSTETFPKVNNEELRTQKKTCPVKIWELQSHQSGFWNSWRILGVHGCDKNSDQKIRWFVYQRKTCWSGWSWFCNTDWKRFCSST